MVGCGGGPVAPGDIIETLSARVETANVVFHYTPGDSVDSDWQQRFHDWIAGELGVQLPRKLEYFKYTGRAQMQSLAGRSTNGFAEPSVFTVHSIFSRHGHEAVHVYSALVGRPSDFFNEGIAVALNNEPNPAMLAPFWNGTHVHAHTQLLIDTNRFVSLQTMVTTSSFRDVDEFVGYGEGGSFMLFLIEEFGIDSMLAFFRISARDDPRDRIETNFRAVWQMSLEEAETLWLDAVNAWSGVP